MEQSNALTSMKTVKCQHCGREISTNNIERHKEPCRLRKPKLTPEEVKQKRRQNAEKARSSITKETREIINKKVSEAHRRGCYDKANREKIGKPGKPHSEESKRLISEKARQSKHRRLRKNTQEYCGVLMDSSWEVKLAVWLDERSIAWERPGPLTYDDNRSYFPDFYLPELDLYLDTKNDYLIRIDSEKVGKAALQNDVEVIILSKSELTQLGVM